MALLSKRYCVEWKQSAADSIRADYGLPNMVDILQPIVPETSMAGLTVTPSFDRKISSDSWSYYAQDQFAFGEQWKLRVGLRNDVMDYKDDGSSVIAGAYTPRVVDESVTLSSGSIGMVYQPTSLLAFYAGYNKGAFVNLATESTLLTNEPENSEQREIGMKLQTPQGLADVNVAVFDTEREDYFITLFGATSPTQDGHDQTQGIEIDLGLHPLTGWDITANAVNMDAETLSRNVASNAVFGVINESVHGKKTTGVSENIYSVWSSYRIQQGAAQGLLLGVGMTHKSESYADSLNRYEVPAYTVFDASVSYQMKQWEAAINLKNLADETYYTNPTFSGALPGDPRSVFLSARFYLN